MVLADALGRHPDELRADLQRHYGIDLDQAMAGGHSAAHVGALLANLPRDAALFQAVDDDAMWTLEAILLAEVRNGIQGLMYMLADPATRGAPPTPIGPSWMRNTGRTLEAMVMPVDELMAELSKPRR